MRIILPIFTGLLVILFITGQSSAQAGVAFTILDTIISWGSTIIFTKDALTDDTGENIQKILTDIDKISTDLNNLGTHMEIELDIMLNTLLHDIELTVQLQSLKAELLNYLYEVDHYHDESLKYSPGKYTNETLHKFVDTVLYDSNSLPRILVRMHDKFNPGVHVELNPGFLSLIAQKANLHLPTECEREITPHQLMYYIYVQLITAEMKAFATINKVYALKSWLENFKFDYEAELKETKLNFENGVQEIHQLFMKQLARLPRHLRQCHVTTPKRGVDFLELEKFSRAKLMEINFDKQWKCNCCLSPEASYTENGIKIKVHNCKSLSESMKACPAESGLLHEYSWWSDNNGTYGKKSCSAPKTLYAGVVVGEAYIANIPPPTTPCSNWYCSGDQTMKRRGDTNAWLISSKPQIADIWNNMVVTGLQFIVKDKTIYLQIQQGKFSDNGLAYYDIAWKGVDTPTNVSRAFAFFELDERIGADQKTLYLDDINVPKDSVVTGVQLLRGRKSSFFRLYVHATKFDFATGKLTPSENFWCSKYICEEKTPTGDYTRDRIEIDMAGADDPLKGYGFEYDEGTNKMIKFTHTDAHKDAGQTTIPFIDLQPVQVQPAFPLSGVGLYYRGKEGFGGYVAPRIYTLDVTERMVAPEVTV